SHSAPPLLPPFPTRRSSDLAEALARRQRIGLPGAGTDAFRALNAEGDGLPGLVVDQLGDVSTLQFSPLGMKQRQALVVDAIESRSEEHTSELQSRENLVCRR